MNIYLSTDPLPLYVENVCCSEDRAASGKGSNGGSKGQARIKELLAS